MKKSDLDFDLTQRTGYKQSVRELRRYAPANDLEGASAVGEICELKVAVQDGTTTGYVHLFMVRNNRYIIGFRGDGGTAFALQESSEKPKLNRDMIAAALGYEKERDKQKVKQLTLAVSHAALNTYDEQFNKGALSACLKLSTYKEGTNFDEIRQPLSLLVCMISEASRFNCVAGQCADLIDGKPTTTFVPDKGLLTNWGNAMKFKQHLKTSGMTLDQLVELRSQMKSAERELKYHLRLPANSSVGLKDFLNFLSGYACADEVNALKTKSQTDVNVKDALETLTKGAPKLLGKAPGYHLKPNDVQQAAEIVELLSDGNVRMAAANLA